RDKSKPQKEHTLADLPNGAVVSLKLSADQKAVGSIHAEGPSSTGIVKAVDSAQKTITLTLTLTKGDPGVDKTFTVTKFARISVNQYKGKAKDKSQASAYRLADVPTGAVATVRLSPDQQAVVDIVAEGPRIQGVLKTVDAAKGTITVAVWAGK